MDLPTNAPPTLKNAPSFLCFDRLTSNVDPKGRADSMRFHMALLPKGKSSSLMSLCSACMFTVYGVLQVCKIWQQRLCGIQTTCCGQSSSPIGDHSCSHNAPLVLLSCTTHIFQQAPGIWSIAAGLKQEMLTFLNTKGSNIHSQMIPHA
eukprot:1158280-Pelagomonas_calceolata.AAC.6